MTLLVVRAEDEHFGDEWADLLGREIDHGDDAPADELGRPIAISDLGARALHAERSEVDPQLEGGLPGFGEGLGIDDTPTRMSTRSKSAHVSAMARGRTT